jgi:hypothetical protein
MPVAQLGIAPPVVRQDAVTWQFTEFVRNESGAPQRRDYGLVNGWYYAVHVDDSASLSGLSGVALVSGLKEVLASAQGWSFSELQYFTEKISFEIPPRSAARAVVEWRPLVSSAILIMDETTRVEFTVDVGMTMSFQVETTSLDARG